MVLVRTLPLLVLLLGSQSVPPDLKTCRRCTAQTNRACLASKFRCDASCDRHEKGISPKKFDCLQTCKSIEVGCYRKTGEACGSCR